MTSKLEEGIRFALHPNDSPPASEHGPSTTTPTTLPGAGRSDATAGAPALTLAGLQALAWGIAEEKGFHKGRTASRDDTLVRLCLIHSEVSEAVQEVKRHWRDAVPSTEAESEARESLRSRVAEELADILIRCADLAECIGRDLQAAVSEKLEKNQSRPVGYGTPHEGRPGGI